MKRATLFAVLAALCSLANSACSSSSSKLAVTITGAPTTAVVGSQVNVTAVVTHDHAMTGVEWSCTPAPACGQGSFDPLTSLSGEAAVFTAPPGIPSGGQVTITATSVTDPSVSANATITITNAAVATNNFAFYASGEESSQIPYSIAGVVSIATDGSGTVISGEEDYNDGNGLTAPQPLGYVITGGALAIDSSTGLGTLTLNLATNVAYEFPGVMGVETFAVAFSNANHAIITQFDGTATSSGSLDLQTSTATPFGSYSFVAIGAGTSGEPVADGGVFAVDGSGNLTGVVDVNDGGTAAIGTPIPAGAAQLTPADSLGRGFVTGTTGIATAVNYYVVGPEVIRIINVDTTDTGVGSAYGQGATPNFSNGSIGTSVFSIGGSLSEYAGAGQFTTDAGDAKPRSGSRIREGVPVTNNFTGVGDLNELDVYELSAAPFTGTYSINNAGYGSASVDDTFGDVAALGIYAIDPNLNIIDPNSSTSTGGALLAEMDDTLVGIGLLVPQTDTAGGHFQGAYTFGAQGLTDADDDEFDFLGEGSLVDHSFNATGSLSDPLGALTGTAVESSNVTYTATVGGGGRPGRGKMSAFSLASPDFDGPFILDVTTYQANGGLLFWVDIDDDDYFGGYLEQNTLSTSDAVKAAKLESPKH